MTAQTPSQATAKKISLMDIERSQLGLGVMGLFLFMYIVFPESKLFIEQILRIIVFISAMFGKALFLNLPFIHDRNSGIYILGGLLCILAVLEIWEMFCQLKRHLESPGHHDHIEREILKFGGIKLLTEAIGSSNKSYKIISLIWKIYSLEYMLPKVLWWVLIQTLVILALTITSANFIDQVYPTGLGNMAAFFILMNAIKFGVGDDGKCEPILNASGNMIGQQCSSHLYGLPNVPGYGSVVSSDSMVTILFLVLISTIVCFWLEGSLLDDGPSYALTHIENYKTEKKAKSFLDYAKSILGGFSGAYNCITTVESFVPKDASIGLKFGILFITLGFWVFAAWCPIFCLASLEENAGTRIEKLAKDMKKLVEKISTQLLCTNYPKGKINPNTKFQLSAEDKSKLTAEGKPTAEGLKVYWWVSKNVGIPNTKEHSFAALGLYAEINRDYELWEKDHRFVAKQAEDNAAKVKASQPAPPPPRQ